MSKKPRGPGSRRGLLGAFVVVLSFVLLSRAALAHPHVLVEARADIVFNAAGQVVAVKHHWRFDEAFSAFAKQGLDKDGKFTRDSLQPLAEVNVKSLGEFDYFTRMRNGLSKVSYGKPEDYWIDHDESNGTLILNFTLSLTAPAAPMGAGFIVEIGDPEYFVAFDMAKTKPANLLDAPRACLVDVKGPQELDDAATARLSQLPPSIRQLPAEFSGLTQNLSNKLTVKCP